MSDTNLQSQVFEYIKASVDKISDFASKEVPPFIEEFLRWRFVEAEITAIIWVALFIILSCISATWFIKRKAQIFKHEEEGLPYMVCNLIFLGGVGLTFFFTLLPSIYTMVQIHIAPKVYLLEQASKYFNK